VGVNFPDKLPSQTKEFRVIVKTKIIAEIGNSHEGSLGIALSFVDILADTGVDIVKFQMHMGEFEGTPDETFRVAFSQQDLNRRAYWDRVSFSNHEWGVISEYVNQLGMEFLCTPFSVEAAKRIIDITNIKRWKVGSGDAVNFPLIDYLASTSLPLVISTGLVSEEEIEQLKKRLLLLDIWEETTLMHCVSEYPTPLSHSSLGQIEKLKGSGCKIGLSDHSGSTTPSLFAIGKNVDFVEVHMTPHRKFFGPDVSSSLTPAEISSIVRFRDELEITADGEMSKGELFANASETRKLFRKGVYWAGSFAAGHICTFEDLKFLKPVAGIDSIDFESILGKKLVMGVSSLQPVDKNQFEVWE
jgi:N,N'-diacetyllegionaminate synthase